MVAIGVICAYQAATFLIATTAMLAFADVAAQFLRLFEGHPQRGVIAFFHRLSP